MNTNERYHGFEPDANGDGCCAYVGGEMCLQDRTASVHFITTEELAEWRAVVEKATPGPWFDIEHARFKGANHRISTTADGDWDSFANIATVARNDAPLVVLARTALPRLIDEVEAGRREIERTKALKILDAGWGQQGALFSLVSIGEKTYIHVSVSQGYLVYAALPETDPLCEQVKNSLADAYDRVRLCLR